MSRFAPSRIIALIFARSLCFEPKIVAGIVLLALGGLLVSCSSTSSKSSNGIPPPNIAGSWEFLAVSSNGSATGVEVQMTEGQIVDNGIVVPSGQVAADSAQIAFVTLGTGQNQTTNITAFGGSCGALSGTLNGLAGTATALGAPINFTFTANGNIFNATAFLNDTKTILNGTYTPQAGNTCTDPGGTITGTVVSVPTGMYQGQMCSPSETSCSSYDDNVTATVTSKSSTITLNLQLSGLDNTNFTLSGTITGNAFSVLGTFGGGGVNYYGYFEQVYNPTVLANVQSLYLVNAADPCFSSPGTNCTTATIIQVPLV